MTRFVVELSVATSIPFQFLRDLSYPVLLTYLDVLSERARAESV